MPNVYQIVTSKLIEQMEKGNVPWRKPWASVAVQNYQSHKPYRGINRLLLASKTMETGCPYYVTYKQAEDMGGNVKKGAKSEVVVFFKILEKEQEGTDKTKKIPLLRYYRVFNLTDCEGIEWELPKCGNGEHTPHEAAEEVISTYVDNDGPSIVNGDKASYSPALDRVQIPAPELFVSRDAYYSTVFHELTHSTGHKKRLNRKEIVVDNAFGSKDYSREELTAEIGSAFLQSQCGIESDTETEQSAAYLRSWIKVLSEDEKAVVMAANRAEKAVEWINQEQEVTMTEEEGELVAA